MEKITMSNVLLGIITILLTGFGGIYLSDRSNTTNAINTNTNVIREFVIQNTTEHRDIEDKISSVEKRTVGVEIWTGYNDSRITKLENYE